MRVFTIGWDPAFIDYLLTPLERPARIEFVHGLVGDAARVPGLARRHPSAAFVALSKSRAEPLPDPDARLLASLERRGVPTVRSMIQGDRVLRHRPSHDALAYATLLARRIESALCESPPDVVLGSYDNLHSGIGLAVARRLGIPWVALAFTVIPDDRTGFCRALVPDATLPIPAAPHEDVVGLARSLMEKVRARGQKVLAYRPPASLGQWARQYMDYAGNLRRRVVQRDALGVDAWTFPSATERLQDIGRRMRNRAQLPRSRFIASPPAGSYAYYPMHMAPESMLDTWAPHYQDQLAFVTQLSLSLPADVSLVVKLHFSDPDNYSRRQLQALMRLPRTFIADPGASGAAFIEASALVIGIHGTSCLEAALLGKPVLIFGDSPYQHFPRTERALRPDAVAEQVRRMLARPPAGDDEIVAAYAAYLARYMPGRINDWNRPITDEDVARLAACFRALGEHLSDSGRRNWYAVAPFAAS